MRHKTLSITMATADRDGVCQAQSKAGAGTLTINGALATSSVATMDVPRHVSIYAASDNSAKTFTITGTDRYGAALTETITGPNATTTKGSYNFKTITSVSVDAATVGNVEVGSADELESQWIPVNYRMAGVSYDVDQSASASFTHNVQYTLDDVFLSTFAEYGATVYSVGENTADQVGNLGDQQITAIRLLVKTFVSGTATFHVLQQV